MLALQVSTSSLQKSRETACCTLFVLPAVLTPAGLRPTFGDYCRTLDALLVTTKQAPLESSPAYHLVRMDSWIISSACSRWKCSCLLYQAAIPPQLQLNTP
jgi:hypothetical protein